MKRILLMVCRNIFIVPWLYLKLCWYASHTNSIPVEKKMALLKTIVGYANRGGNVEIKAYGVENIPSEGSFMFFPNHQGLYDVLSLVDVCPKPFSVVAKKEVENVPFLKQVFKCMKAYMMDRNDIRQSLQVIVNVTNEVKNGRNYLIFPEGTRSKMGNEMLEFKGGSFKAATKAKCPIVPVALIDSYKAFDTGSAKMLNVQVHFLKPMEYEEYKDMKSTEIAAEVKRRIEETIRANENSNCSLRNQ